MGKRAHVPPDEEVAIFHALNYAGAKIRTLSELNSYKTEAHPNHRENLMSLRVIYSFPLSPGVHN